MNSLYIAWHLIRRTFGSWRSVILFLLVPALTTSAVVGLWGRHTPDTVSIYYWNEDQGAAARHLLGELGRSRYWTLTEVHSREALREKGAAAALWIPGGFSAGLLAGEAVQIGITVHAAGEASHMLKWSVDRTVRLMAAAAAGLPADSPERSAAWERLLEHIARHEIRGVITDYRMTVNPASQLAMGFLVIFLMSLVNSTVSIMLEDRRGRTMSRISAAPVYPLELAFGTLLGCFLIGSIQILSVLLTTRLLLNFDYGMGLGPQLLVLECFLLAVLGIALAVAGTLRSRDHMTTIQSFVTVPTCMLGGCFWPVWIMPEFMQKLSRFVPQSWALDALQRMAGGQSLSSVALNLGVLGLFAFVLLGIGSVVLRPAET